MRELAQEAFAYVLENPGAFFVISFLAGLAGVKTVALGKRGHVVLYWVVGILGAFLGQMGIVYFGLGWLREELSAFHLFFDLLAAYLGSLIPAWIIFLFRPD